MSAPNGWTFDRSDCTCIDDVNEMLEKENTVLDIGLRIDLKTGKTLPPRPEIYSRKIDPKKRGKASRIIATCCPFCGHKFNDDL